MTRPTPAAIRAAAWLVVPVGMDDAAFVSVRDVAMTLAVSERTVARLCVNGALPAYRVGRQWRIGRSDFQRWMRENKSGAWRQFISVVEPGGSVSNGTAKKSASPLAQLLKAKPASISNNSKPNIAR